MCDNWIEKDLLSQPTLNKINKNTISTQHRCWLFMENDQYLITDLSIKLIAKINPRRIPKLKGCFRSTSNKEFQLIFLKQYFYSSMISFKPNKEPYIFMFIDDFELINLENFTNIPKKSDVNTLNFGYHPSVDCQFGKMLRKNPQSISNSTPIRNLNDRQPITQASSIVGETGTSSTHPDNNNDNLPSNLTLLVNNLTPSTNSLNDYTIEIINQDQLSSKDTMKESIKLKKNLNEGFVRDTQSLNESLILAEKNKQDNNMSLFILDDDQTKSKGLNVCSQLNDLPCIEEISTINTSPSIIRNETDVEPNTERTKTKSTSSIEIIYRPKNKITPNKSGNDSDKDESMEPVWVDLTDKSPDLIVIDTVNPSTQTQRYDYLYKKDDTSPSVPIYMSSQLQIENTVSPKSKIKDIKLTRRESTASIGSNCNLQIQNDIFNLDFFNSSPNSAKRKRQLISNKNGISDDFQRSMNKTNSNKQTNVYEETDDEEDDTNKNYNRRAPCESDDEVMEDINDAVSVQTHKTNTSKKSVFSSSSSVTSASSSSSDSSFAISLSPSSSSISLNDKSSLIFAPKRYYAFKDHLYKKSHSESKSKHFQNKRVNEIFSPIKKSKNIRVPHTEKRSCAALASSSSILLNSNVLDKFINLDRTKINSSNSNNNNTGNESSNNRRRRLFNPFDYNVDKAFDPVNISEKSERSTNSSNKSNVSIPFQEKSIPRGQLAYANPNHTSSLANSSNIISNIDFSISTTQMSEQQLALINYNFKLNKDEFQDYLVENSLQATEINIDK